MTSQHIHLFACDLGTVARLTCLDSPRTPVNPTASLSDPMGPGLAFECPAMPLQCTLLPGLGVRAECCVCPARTSGVNTGPPWPGSEETWGSVPPGFGAGKCEESDVLKTLRTLS